ncbi:MAG: hypothetical protein HKN54_01145 [Flavobacteriaceae bacterium]|nr:hypothetical protein [Flavobacteriaceae bacterium]
MRRINAFWWVALLVILFLQIIQMKYVGVAEMLEIQFNDSISFFIEKVEANTENIRNTVYLDFIYIVVYTLLFYLSFRIFDDSLNLKLKKKHFLICLIPGLIDIVENIMLLSLLKNPALPNLFSAYQLVVIFKWTVANIFLLMIMAILLYHVLLFLNRLINKLFSLK